jgi:hypothetical protein
MTLLNERQANWIADLLEAGHIHYELQERRFENAFYNNGLFVEEEDDRSVKKTNIRQYTRHEFVQTLMTRPMARFKRFLAVAH